MELAKFVIHRLHNKTETKGKQGISTKTQNWAEKHIKPSKNTTDRWQIWMTLGGGGGVVTLGNGDGDGDTDGDTSNATFTMCVCLNVEV